MILGTIIFMYVLLGASNILLFAKVPTVSSEPAISINSYVVYSSLKQPKNGNFIVFKRDDPNFGMGSWIFRLIASEGDVVEINNGVLKVNDSMVDKNRILQYSYLLPEKKFNQVADYVSPDYSGKVSDNVIITYLSEDIAKKYKLDVYRVIRKKGEVEDNALRVFKKPWNQDQFGPIIVPKDSIFVLGDNRHNALDSRYFGFVASDAIIGTVLWK